MLPKGVLGRDYYRRLFVYVNNEIKYKKSQENFSKEISFDLIKESNWIKIDL
jgi:ribosomal protein L13